MKEIKRIGVIGAGMMGSGIAQVAAQAGFDVIMTDVKDELIKRGFSNIKKSLSISLEKGKMAQMDVDSVIKRITGTLCLEDVAREAEIIIEAIPENLGLKKELFRQLDQICHSHTIFATNTSSFSITEISTATNRPVKVIGMHFASPVPVMKGVEIIRGLETDNDTIETVVSLAKQLGKEVFEAKDFPGFCVNRLFPLLVNEAFHVLMDGVSTAEDIDKGIRLNLRHPMGPLELGDFVGLDTILSVLEYLHREIGERYRPSPLLKKLVVAGCLGVKAGKGVYDYTSGLKKSRTF